MNWADGDAADKTVTVKGDTTFEANETVHLTLSNEFSASLGSPKSATLTITNDDSQPTVSIGDRTLAEGDSGTTTFAFTVTLSE